MLTTQTIMRIATEAADGDEEIGSVVATAYDRVGLKGVVTLEESKTLSYCTLDVVNGAQYDEGYISEKFVTDSDKKVAVLEKPYILLYSGKISYEENIVAIVSSVSEEIKKNEGSLFIIAENVTSNALTYLENQKEKGLLRNAAIQNPGFAEDRFAILVDIGNLTNTDVVFEDVIQGDFKNISFDHLGSADTIKIYPDYTIIVNGSGEDELIQARVSELRDKIFELDENGDYTPTTRKLWDRLIKLVAGVGVVYVGADSRPAFKLKMARAENALKAVKIAIEEDSTPGSGYDINRKFSWI